MVKKKVQTVGASMKRTFVSPENILSISHQCNLLDMPRSTYYYQPKPLSPRDIQIMNAMDEIYMDFPYYGARKISQALKRKKYKVGRKHIRTLMVRMGISAEMPKKSLSNPHPDHKKYPYLLKGVKITRPNQVWSTDITYIRLKQGFVYLVAVMDWYSRYVISWRLSTTLDNQFCCEALEEALEQGCPEIFNSDQGIQFTSSNFTDILKRKEIRISMDGRGRALDNVFIERLWRNLKYEEVYRNDYLDVSDCCRHIKEYFRKYNEERLHESLDYRTPYEVHFILNEAMMRKTG
jgi:putative transposase